MGEPTKEEYYRASWNTIVAIALEQYDMDHYTASIYAWVVFGRMTHSDYTKMSH